VTLYWQTSYVTTLAIKDDQGELIALYDNAKDSTKIIDSGSMQVTISRPTTSFLMTCTGFTPQGQPAPPAPPPVVVTGPDPTISITFDPKQNPPGTITIKWDVPYDFDSVQGSAQFSLSGTAVCNLPLTPITPLPQRTGTQEIKLLSFLPPGTYSMDYSVVYSYKNQQVFKIEKTFTFQL
jgi:hypothetical protein